MVSLFYFKSMSLNERSFLYDIMGGSLTISFSDACCCKVLLPRRIFLNILNCWVTLCNDGQDSYFCVVFVEECPCPSFKFNPKGRVLNSLMLSSNILLKSLF